MATLSASALSAEHIITAGQYNALLSGVQLIHLANTALFGGFNYQVSASASGTTGGPLGSSPWLHFPATNSGLNNALKYPHWHLMFQAVTANNTGAWIVNYRGNALNLISGTALASANWSHNGVDGAVTERSTNGESAINAADTQRHQLRIYSDNASGGVLPNRHTAKWDMASVFTGTLVLHLAPNAGVTGSAIWEVSTDDATYVTALATAYTAASPASWFLTAGAVARYIRVRLGITAVAAGTLHENAAKLWFFTANASATALAGKINAYSAFPSGELIRVIYTAATTYNLSAQIMPSPFIPI